MIDIKETEWEDRGWINLAQDRDKWQAVECGNEISGPYKCWEFLD